MLMNINEIKQLTPRQKRNLVVTTLRLLKMQQAVDCEVMSSHKMMAAALLSVGSAFEFSFLLQSNMKEVERLLNEPLYQKFTISKRRGGFRVIYAPTQGLKFLQLKLNRFLQAYYYCVKPACVHGFVLKPKAVKEAVGIVSNARVHVGKRHLLNIDLKDFFPSINAGRVKSLFLSDVFGFDTPIAVAFALLTTYKGFLPIGAPTSPVISNFVCLGLDADLMVFAKETGLSFSRYADDLTFSHAVPFTPHNVDAIFAIIQKHGFMVNEKKVRMVGCNRKQTVTGLTVNEKVNVDRKLLKKIRAMLHDLNKNGVEAAAMHHFQLSDHFAQRYVDKFFDELRGYIDFVGQVRGRDDALYLRFMRAL